MDILSTVDTQNTLNVNTCGENWTSGVTNKGKDINWYRCIYMECAEAVGYMAYKHWKSLDQKEDTDAIKMEIVDIYHFLLSLLIEQKGIEATKQFLEEFRNHFEHQHDDFKEDKFIAFESMMAKVITGNFNSIGLLNAFGKMLWAFDMSLNELVSIYVLKNTLNQFRQDNGYKEGTYIKNWALNIGEDIEDNEVALRLLEKVDTPDELYMLMNNHYNLVKILNRKG